MLLEFNNRNVGVVMSSAFFGFFAHTGFIKALEELGVRPIGYSGTSAGALVAGCCAAGLSSEQIQKNLYGIRRSDFWDPDYLSLLGRLPLFLKGWTGLLKGNKYRSLLRRDLPVHTFEECRFPCAIGAVDITAKKKKVFTTGSLVDAIAASGAVPGMFKPAEIDGRLYIDGGLADKAPVRDLYELTRPKVIIVHYLPTRNLELPENYFLKRKFTTLKIANLCSAIAREEDYKLQCDYVRARGCEVVEISPEVTKVNPGSLEKGLLALEEAYQFTRENLKPLI